MASISEATHGKNLSNFGLLITNYTNMGVAYNPGKASLKLVGLNALKTDAAAAHKLVGEEWVEYRRIAAERAVGYKPLNRLVTRCLNILLSSEALEPVKDGAKALANKIRGKNSSAPTPEPVPGETPQEKKHSTSQQSFVMKAENFGLFIEMLRAESTYLPGKDDIKLVALDALLATLVAKNGTVDTAFVNWKAALSDRDKLFYDETTGMLDVAYDSKLYVKGDFGSDSPEYNAVKSIKFRRKKQ